MQIYCDFDGTVTRQDTTDLVLRELAAPGWEQLEAAWTSGEISAAKCMREQVALIGGDDAALEAVLAQVDLRPGFRSFVRWCDRQSLPLTIVSDGVDRLIRSVLARHGLQHLPVVANRLSGAPGQRRLEQPWSEPTCAAGSGVCKCRVVRPDRRSSMVYVGDGRSDFCVAESAGLLFARGALARHCVQNRLAFVPYDTFADVHRYLFLVHQENLTPAEWLVAGTIGEMA